MRTDVPRAVSALANTFSLRNWDRGKVQTAGRLPEVGAGSSEV